jgi:hypothetical protein
MKTILARGLVLVSLGAVAFGYASIVFWSVPNAEAIALSAMPRPYVYRTLMPWLAHGLVAVGLRADAAIVVLLFLAAIGLVYAIKFLSETFKR